MSREKKDDYGCRGTSCRPGRFSEIVMEDDAASIFTPKAPTFILGFANVGLIGSISASTLIEQLKMEQVAHVLSDKFPPVAVFYDGVLKQPFRIFYAKKHDLIVSFCEIPLSARYFTDTAHTLMRWALNVGVKEVVLLQGLAAEMPIEGDNPVFVAAEKVIQENLTKYGVQILPKGILLGLEAAILNVCLNSKLDGHVLMTPVNPQIPSPEGAAAILETLNKIYKLDVKTDELKEEGAKIKKKLMEMATQVQNQQMRDSGFVDSKASSQLFI
ncbi:MAG: hypothetical protein RBG13Loki_3485 [Promethearchaeota archaeon CR_4]|nr:MAG: hypothetical protein RBG13Loki_3485 [Candidatus Lokiarchaeota archaeon CR_4]